MSFNSISFDSRMLADQIVQQYPDNRYVPGMCQNENFYSDPTAHLIHCIFRCNPIDDSGEIR